MTSKRAMKASPPWDSSKKGILVIKTDHFSIMGVDQAYEQNRKVVKVNDGAIDILKTKQLC